MLRPLLVLLLVSIGSVESVFGQPKWIRRDDLIVRVKATVTHLSDGYYRYAYVFVNDTASHQAMHRAIVDLNDKWPEHGGTLRNTVPPTQKEWGQFPSVGRKLRWRASYDTSGSDFLELPPRSAIAPGESLSFSFETKGLPGIGGFWAAGWAPWYFSSDEKDSLRRGGYDIEKSRAVDENFFKGTTIVRRDPPSPFEPSALLDTIEDYVHRSKAMGWVGNDGVVTSLDQKLENARRHIQQGKMQPAVDILQAFVREVEAQQGKALTSEAYALLKYNAEYLIQRLNERQ